MTGNTRQDWVDIAKAFAIIAVVLGHINYQYPKIALLPLSSMIAWLWHVPVFFMIGGFFLKDERLVKPVSFVKGKIKSLYLLILYLYVPFTLLHNVLLDIGFYDTAIEYGGKHVDYWTTGQFLRRLAEVIFLAGREPILGAMWFVYVLFMALCYLSFVSAIVNKITPPSRRQDWFEKARCLTLLTVAVAASFLTNVFDFTIPRFNNVFTAGWLIYVGMQVVQRFKLKFDSWFLGGVSLVVFYSFAVLRGSVHLNHNEFDDIISLTASTLSALYVVCFLSKKCKRWLTKVLVAVGRDSFYIMGLHFLCFKFGTILLNSYFGSSYNYALLNPQASNITLYGYYAAIGILMPLAIIWLWRRARAVVFRAFLVVKR